MRTRTPSSSLDTASLLRWGIVGVAAFTLIGLIFELVFLRHWGGTQTIVWIAIAGLVPAVVVLVFRPSRRSVQGARVLAIAVALIAIIGMGLHARENLQAGPMDRDYAATWDTMSPVEQLWTATTGAVGPAPTLAPGALAEIGLLLLLATFRHPALAVDRPALSQRPTPVDEPEALT